MANRGKKRKSYYSDFKSAKRWKGVLSVGMKGFLCSTGNTKVKECIREAYNLLNEYAEKTIIVKKEEVAGESIEDELERELKDMRKTPSERMFQAVDTGAGSTVFIRTTIDDPAKLGNEIISDIFATKQARSIFLLRMVPIEVTCKAYIDDIRKAADQMFDVPFKCDPVTFNVFYKARYNSSLLRDEVVAAMATLVKDRNPSHKVDLTTPKKTVIVEVIKGVCCLSVVTDFYTYRKYNLQEAAKGETAQTTADSDNSAVLAVDAKETASEPKPIEDEPKPIKDEPKPNEKNAPNVDLELPSKPVVETTTGNGTNKSIENIDSNDETTKELPQDE